MNTVIDFRNFEPRTRHALFLSLFEGLKDGTSFEFVNDHDPMPLYKQVQAMNIPNLNWEYALKGPSEWRVQISKAKFETKDEGCCGICGGHGHAK
jgi:uncharacterized protein (DUF2249 family)